MFNFLKRLVDGEKRKITETDEVSLEKLQGKESESATEEQEQQQERQLVDTKLSLPPDWSLEKEKISYAQKEIMENEVADMPPIKEGAIAINGVYAVKDGNKLEVGIYIRNAMARNLVLGRAYLTITDLKGNVQARQMFNLSELGKIPPYSARPWEIYYDAENVFVDEIKYDDWKLVFDIDETLSQEISPIIQQVSGFDAQEFEQEVQMKRLKEFVEQLPDMTAGQMDFNIYRANFNKNGDLEAEIIVRNANKEKVVISELPLGIEDAQGRDIAVGIFKWPKGLEVGPLTILHKELTFPAKAVLLKDADLENCSLYIKE